MEAANTDNTTHVRWLIAWARQLLASLLLLIRKAIALVLAFCSIVINAFNNAGSTFYNVLFTAWRNQIAWPYFWATFAAANEFFSCMFSYAPSSHDSFLRWMDVPIDIESQKKDAIERLTPLCVEIFPDDSRLQEQLLNWCLEARFLDISTTDDNHASAAYYQLKELNISTLHTAEKSLNAELAEKKNSLTHLINQSSLTESKKQNYIRDFLYIPFRAIKQRLKQQAKPPWQQWMHPLGELICFAVALTNAICSYFAGWALSDLADLRNTSTIISAFAISMTAFCLSMVYTRSNIRKLFDSFFNAVRHQPLHENALNIFLTPRKLFALIMAITASLVNSLFAYNTLKLMVPYFLSTIGMPTLYLFGFSQYLVLMIIGLTILGNIMEQYRQIKRTLDPNYEVDSTQTLVKQTILGLDTDHFSWQVLHYVAKFSYLISWLISPAAPFNSAMNLGLSWDLSCMVAMVALFVNLFSTFPDLPNALIRWFYQPTAIAINKVTTSVEPSIPTTKNFMPPPAQSPSSQPSGNDTNTVRSSSDSPPAQNQITASTL